jgi:hypothetical protein
VASDPVDKGTVPETRTRDGKNTSEVMSELQPKVYCQGYAEYANKVPHA